LEWEFLWLLTLWTDVWCVFDLVWLEAMAGDTTRAAAGRKNANAAIRRLNEVITSVCSGGLEGRKRLPVGVKFSP
jgi:hypothetical protein